MNWIKAQASNGNGGSNCVEVALMDDGERIAVRDSKQNGRSSQAFLIFTKPEFAAFIDGASKGEFNHLVEG